MSNLGRRRLRHEAREADRAWPAERRDAVCRLAAAGIPLTTIGLVADVSRQYISRLVLSEQAKAKNE